MVGLGGGSMAKGGLNRVQNLILNRVVAFLCVGYIQPDLMLLGVVDDVIVSGVA